MAQSTKSAVEPILPVRLGKGDVLYARGIKAGRWVFTTGNMAQDFGRGIAEDVISPRLPHAGRPKNEKEAERVFDNIEEVLRAAGSDWANVVRVDQYYPRPTAVDHYHVVRHARFGSSIPPSTSILMPNLLLADAEMDVQVIAAVPGLGFTAEHMKHRDLAGHPTSGYSPALRVGDFVFAAGATASPVGDDPAHRGLPEAAQRPEYSQWRGEPIKLETEYIINKKIIPSLALGGASLANVLKAQVYITHLEDFAPFNVVWRKYFPDNPPATTLVPSPKEALSNRYARIEINVLALADNGATKRSVIDTDVYTGYEANSAAIRAGDLLFASGLMAIDRAGLVPSAEVDPRQANLQSSIRAQADCILENARKICEAAGTSLANVVRAQHFLADIGDFYDVYQVWQKHLPGAPIPFSAIEIASPLPVPGCTLLMDLWFYAP
jgi:enamine deaminase RidA (YjgF/YER057c/UK114 family)